MAYNSNKGNQHSGDIQFESDPTDTQIDFENDFVAIKTNAQQRFIVSGSFITSSIPLSCSVDIAARSLTLDVGKTIGIAGDTDLITLTANTVAVAGALTASTDLAGRSLVLDVGKTIGIPGDTNLMSLTANTLTIEGALTASTDLAGRSLVLDSNKTIGIVSDTNLLTLQANRLVVSGIMSASAGLTGSALKMDGDISIGGALTGSGIRTTLLGIELDTNGKVGTASDPDLLTLTSNRLDVAGNMTITNGAFIGTSTDNDLLRLAANSLSINGALSASAGLSGSVVRASDNKLSLHNRTDGNKNPEIKIHSDNLYINQTTANKHVRIKLGDDVAQSSFQIRNGSDSNVVTVDSIGRTDVTALTASAGAIVSGSMAVSGSVRSSYTYRGNSGGYGIAADDSVVIFNNGSGQVATLPRITIANHGVMYYVKNIGAGAITLTGSTGHDQFIDGQQTLTLSQGDSAKVIGHALGAGFGWAVLSYHNV